MEMNLPDYLPYPVSVGTVFNTRQCRTFLCETCVNRPLGTKEKVMKSVGGRIYLAVFAAMVLSAAFALAQGIVTGSISGVVQDPQGAVVPNASVTVRHLTTNRVFTTQTTSAGVIALRDLPTGTYDLKIDAANFRAYESKSLTVSVGKDT